ncbi:MAG: ATP-binding protein [Candidatus Schekmanbacteria bacterium]|nr:ATP-binding protein [Candidatus Schekmanbacteria bacterium]
MHFLNRHSERLRLDRLLARSDSALAVICGRRRIGKTRLLLEWRAVHGGIYFVGDQSTAPMQREQLSRAIEESFPGFASVVYPSWRSLLSRLAREAAARNWRGPLILDEIPYLVSTSPELPSVLQAWLDTEAQQARLIVAIAGSSQRMMQGIVLDQSAPLYQRAREILDLQPLPPVCLHDAFAVGDAAACVPLYAAWGGIPKYWELAADLGMNVFDQLEHLVLDPLGALHNEPNTLLFEEDPPAIHARPLLEAIGAGAHQVSEIAARIGRPATALSEPLARLQELGLVRREVPFGKTPRGTKVSLYRIDDPFCRLWFRVVAGNRAALVSGTRATRLLWLSRHWPSLVAAAWEDLCRSAVARLPPDHPLGRLGPWMPASRWWAGRGEHPPGQPSAEWDLVADSCNADQALLGEVKWRETPLSAKDLRHEINRLRKRVRPLLGPNYAARSVRYVLCVPQIEDDTELDDTELDDTFLLTADAVFSSFGT